MKYDLASSLIRLPNYWKEEKHCTERAFELLDIFHMADMLYAAAACCSSDRPSGRSGGERGNRAGKGALDEWLQMPESDLRVSFRSMHRAGCSAGNSLRLSAAATILPKECG